MAQLPLLLCEPPELVNAVTEDHVTIDGVIVPATSLSLPRARALAECAASEKLPYVKLLECRSSTAEGRPVKETVVIEVAVERPQRPFHDIRYVECLAVEFEADDRFAPEVLALRRDFPCVPHVNLRVAEVPRSLCLYSDPWREVAPRWTPAAFIERIRFWLAATARGELHQEDQPLEPLLLGTGLRVILPSDIFLDLDAADPVRLDIHLASDREDCRTLFAVRARHDGEADPPNPYVGTTFRAKPQVHGLIRRKPQHLEELHEFLRSGGIDLIGSLRERFKSWTDLPRLLQAKLAVIVGLPVARNTGDATERWEYWAFTTTESVREVGAEIGLWEVHDELVGLLIKPDNTRRGAAVPILVLSPGLAFTPEGAAAANYISADPCKVVAVGAGALGSQVITSLYRSGFGDWTIVDEDDLLPHNLARHELPGCYIGYPKSLALSNHLNLIYPDRAKGIVADVLAPGDKAEALNAAFAQAEVILDLSASAPVARWISTAVESSARRLSAFLNPEGIDAVIIAEDNERQSKLDELEAQYYRAVNSVDELAGHLTSNRNSLRYCRSCGDISTTMSTPLVSTLSALVSAGIRKALSLDGASIQLLCCNPESLAVTPISIEPQGRIRQAFGDWTLVLDEQLLSTLAELRAKKLPNETGGVLIGMYELDRRVIHVVETIPSPPDSDEWPTLYIRGSEGLLDSVEAIADRTAGQLAYVGEWHSHPQGCAIHPSGDDLQVFAWLTDHMATDSRPALMAIVGDDGASSWYLGEMLKSGGWEVGKLASGAKHDFTK